MEMQTITKFEDLTLEERVKICNGCGGKGGWVTPPRALFFEDECNHHDYGYWKGGSKAQRKVCDLKLKSAMIKACKKLTWIKWIRYRPWCNLYYRAVRISGSKYFRFV